MLLLVCSSESCHGVLVSTDVGTTLRPFDFACVWSERALCELSLFLQLSTGLLGCTLFLQVRWVVQVVSGSCNRALGSMQLRSEGASIQFLVSLCLPFSFKLLLQLGLVSLHTSHSVLVFFPVNSSGFHRLLLFINFSRFWLNFRGECAFSHRKQNSFSLLKARYFNETPLIIQKIVAQ